MRNSRKDNPNALLPGDKLYLRPKEEKTIEVGTEIKHRFYRAGIPIELKIKLLENGKPRKNMRYTLQIDGKVVSAKYAKTDGDGKIKIYKLSPLATEGFLMLEDGTSYVLKLKELDPVDSTSGIQARLANLGYGPGPINGEHNHKTRAALAWFQKSHNLKATGEPDDQTKEKLVEVYGR